jgi:thiamine-monophosphate kinase
MTVAEIGEKKLISEVIRPLFNPKGDPNSVGDDCAVIPITEGLAFCISTDRVPADLVSYRQGLINDRQLGYYLAVLNISDLAAAGASPRGLMLNLGLPRDLPIDRLTEILHGAADAAKEYECPVVGGDLSDSLELNLVAISIGVVAGSERLYRSRAQPGDLVFCSGSVGITPAAFAYFLSSLKGRLPEQDEAALCVHFRQPRARVALGSLLRESGACSSAMDNTDGLAQSVLELANASGVAMELSENLIPVDALCTKVASLAGQSAVDLALGPGADFQLIGTIQPNAPNYAAIEPEITVIGSVHSGSGVWMKKNNQEAVQFDVKGWNYYIKPSGQ